MNPYPGLRPFRADELRFYTGREAVLREVVTTVSVRPLTVLFARSGIGKSSFLTCRLIPELESTRPVRYLNEWGGEPAVELIERSLAELAEQQRSLESSVSEAEDRPEIPVLVLDQFEDVFKLDADRIALWTALGKILNVDDPPAHIVISMREEWMGAWMEARDYVPDALRNTIRLTPLSRKELVRAITLPAKSAGDAIAVSREFAEGLLDELREPNAYGFGEDYVEAGLVQLVCRRLWGEAEKNNLPAIDLALYRSLGGIEGIEREYVWRALGESERAFSAADRVLWIGISRNLTYGKDVKSVVSAESIAATLTLDDLGFAGPATVAKQLPRRARTFLRLRPDVRKAPPTKLLRWISRVLDSAVSAGFLKRLASQSDGRTQYELIHDSLGPIFGQFAIEFDRRLTQRWRSSATILFGAFPLLALGSLAVLASQDQFLADVASLNGPGSFFAALLRGVSGVLVPALWVLATVVAVFAASKGLVAVSRALNFAFRYPALRRLSAGSLGFGIPLWLQWLRWAGIASAGAAIVAAMFWSADAAATWYHARVTQRLEIARFPLDRGSRRSSIDASEVVCAPADAPTWRSASDGEQLLRFGATSSCFVLPALQRPTVNYTLLTWIYLTPPYRSGAIMGLSRTSTYDSALYYDETISRFSFGVYDAGINSSIGANGPKVELPRWHMIAVVRYDHSYDWLGNAGQRLYVDGILADSGPVEVSGKNANRLLLGNDLHHEPGGFGGYLRDVRVFGRALSRDEILQIYIDDVEGTPLYSRVPLRVSTCSRGSCK